MVVKHISGKSNIKFTATGRLRGFRIIERVKYNKKVIIITSAITIVLIILGIFIPYVLILAGINIIVEIVILFWFEPPKEKIVEKTEVKDEPHLQNP